MTLKRIILILLLVLAVAAPMYYNPYWPPILEIINGKVVGLIGVGWNGRTTPAAVTFGAAITTGVSSNTGSMQAGILTFNDNTGSPFNSSMNRIKIQDGKLAQNWGANTVYGRDNEVQPTSGNAGNFIFINTANSCTSGGSAPVWNQTPGVPINDGNVGAGTNCIWVNLGITALSYVTTVNYVNQNTLTLGLAPDVTSSAVQYTVGSDSTTPINNAIASQTYPNGSGVVALPCASVIFASTINVGLPPQAGGHGVELEGCGWGSSMSTSNNIGDVIIYDGPGATPMIQVQSTYGFRIHGMRLIGNQYKPPSSCLEMKSPSGGPLNKDSNAYDLWCGDGGPFPEDDTVALENSCWSYTPLANGADNAPNNYWNLRCNSWMDFGLDIPLAGYAGGAVFNNTKYDGSGLNYEAGAQRIAASSVVESGTSFKSAGPVAFDITPTGSLTATGTRAEKTGRLAVCDMQGLANSFAGSSTFVDTNFQLDSAGTASDGKIVDCDSTAPGGAVTGSYTFNINGFKYSQSGSPFSGTPLFAIGSTSTNPNTYSVLMNVFGSPTLTWNNFAASITTGNHASICLNNINQYSGRLNNCVDLITGALSSIHINPNNWPIASNEMTQPLVIDSGASMTALPSPVTNGSACTVKVAGSSTCLYKVSMKDRNGETVPFGTGGGFSCTSSAAAGSQDNVIHFYPPDKGETEYCFYGDDCASGSFKLLTGAPNAGQDNCIPRSQVDKTTLFPQVSIEDNNLTRSGTSPPTTDTTGQLSLAPAGMLCAGTVALTSGSPSTATVSNGCITTQCRPSCTDETSASAIKCVPSGGSLALTGPNTVTDTIAWACL